MRVERSFVSVGVNRVANALDWGEDGRVAYGGHHMVVVYDVQAAAIESTMVGHTGSVNCVCWIPHGVALGARLVASGATDGDVRVWGVSDTPTAPAASTGDKEPWRCIAVLQGHTSPVTALACYPINGDDIPHDSFVLVSTAGDRALHVWLCQPGSAHGDGKGTPWPLDAAENAFGQERWHLCQRIHGGAHIQQALALTHLPGSPGQLLLASGGTDKHIHLYLRAAQKHSEFQAVCRLPGHENWVRSLALCHVYAESGGVQLLLASASQDRYGRVWSITHRDQEDCASSQQPDDALDAIARYAPKLSFVADGRSFLVAQEALLIGHEDWVHSICWRPPRPPGLGPSTPGMHIAQPRQHLCLLTSSMDRTMMLWQFDSDSHLWMSLASVGDAGAQCLGYFGGCFSPDGRDILAHGYTGAMHLWRSSPDGDGGDCGGSVADCSWVPRHALGGHCAPVVDCCWAMDGACVLSVGEDQTARVFTAIHGHWCEIARPQVHGHDFTCVASVPQGAGTTTDGTPPVYTFISGSEEKMLRAFEAPEVFEDTLAAVRGGQLLDHTQRAQAHRAFGAAIPALGLSNKALFRDQDGVQGADPGGSGGGSGMPIGDSVIPGSSYADGPDFAPFASPAAMSGPPLEEHLAQNTLWPEVHKMYGHGNDVHCLAISPDGRYAASACIAKSAPAAEVWVWAIGSWRGVAQLRAHTLTVTALVWSNNNKFLASCSRDRSFSIFRRTAVPGGDDSFHLVQRVKSAHSRVLWDIAWSPDDHLFASGSRDESVKLWSTTAADPNVHAVVGDQADVTLPAFGSAVCALAFVPASQSVPSGGASYTLAVGLDDGRMQLWSVRRDAPSLEMTCTAIWRTDRFFQHAAAIRSIAFRVIPHNQPNNAANCAFEVATCGNDHSVRIFAVLL